MNSLGSAFSRCISLILICLLAAPTMAYASPKPLNPEQVHARIQKLGAGNWVGVRLQTGVAFSGKIMSVDEHSFGLQRYGETAPTPVAYSDVAFIEMAISASRFSPKPLTAEAVRQRLLKRGLGNWVAVQLVNGVAFEGRLVNVDENSFGLQLWGDPEVTPVAFSDVVYLQAGLTGGEKALLIGLPLAFAGAAIGGIVAFKNNEPKMPTMPTLPATPVYPIW